MEHRAISRWPPTDCVGGDQSLTACVRRWRAARRGIVTVNLNERDVVDFVVPMAGVGDPVSAEQQRASRLAPRLDRLPCLVKVAQLVDDPSDKGPHGVTARSTHGGAQRGGRGDNQQTDRSANEAEEGGCSARRGAGAKPADRTSN